MAVLARLVWDDPSLETLAIFGDPWAWIVTGRDGREGFGPATTASDGEGDYDRDCE